MDVALWIVAGFLAATFAGTGITKLTQPTEVLVEKGMGYVEDFTAQQVRALGAVEVLAAFALVVPPLVHVAAFLAPLAASGLVLLMIGAIVTHARRSELQPALVCAALLVMAGFVAWGRFGPHAF
jgi:hypothetical protein